MVKLKSFVIPSVLFSVISCKLTSEDSSTKDVIEFNDNAGMAVGAGINSLDLSVKGDCVERTALESASDINAQSVTFALEKIESFQGNENGR